jgi:hypothetical protein
VRLSHVLSFRYCLVLFSVFEVAGIQLADLPSCTIDWCYLVSGQNEALGNHSRTETGSQEREYYLAMS